MSSAILIHFNCVYWEVTQKICLLFLLNYKRRIDISALHKKITRRKKVAENLCSHFYLQKVPA